MLASSKIFQEQLMHLIVAPHETEFVLLLLVLKSHQAVFFQNSFVAMERELPRCVEVVLPNSLMLLVCFFEFVG